MRIFGLLLLVSPLLIAQPWNYNFGTTIGTYNTNNSSSTTFLPQPPTGGGEDRVRVSNGQGGSFNLENQIIIFGSNSYLRIVASSGSSVTKFSIYDYSASTSFTLRFRIRFGASDGSATGATSGTWYLFVGDGNIYSNDQSFISSQVYTGIRWAFGTSGNVTTKYRSGGSWISTGISGNPFTQGVTYIVDIYGNNSVSTANYTYGTSQSIASNTFDLWVDGVLIGNDLSKSALNDAVNIDSYMFYGVSSTSNVANIFLDDIVYTNTIAANPLPVELSAFSAAIISKGVKLNWRTETEVNNYGFEILRSTQDRKSVV